MRFKIIPMAALLVLLNSSCNNGELDRSNQQRDSLMSVLKERESGLSEKESALNEFIESFNEVERNLDCVAVRQHLIYSSTDKSKGEMQGNQRDKINAQIAAINDLMEDNRKTIADLQKKLKKSGSKNRKLEETVATLQGQLAQKDSELAALNDKLNALNLKVTQLQTALDSSTTMNANQSKTIQENLAALHTAYYLVASSKSLKEAQIIDRKGGLLGIGKTSKLSENFDRGKFTKIDYTETANIPVNSTQVRMITNHPPDAYKMERDAKDKDIVTNIVVTNPERFWSVSKFLVVEGNPVKK
jgi:septal ring factor EnvC (AmiA/AmiB activator)